MSEKEKWLAGLYDQLTTESFESSIQRSGLTAVTEHLPAERLSERLAEQVARELLPLLAKASHKPSPGVADNAVALVNALVETARQWVGDNEPIDPVVSPPQVLRALHLGASAPRLPATGLSQPWLFTAGKDSPALLHELRAELADCDHVDILVSFITKAGVRKIVDTLNLITSQSAQGHSKTSIRVISTTYTGATDPEALDTLARLPGCEVRVSLDGSRTRLHAKAWIFQRRNGFGSAYVGSANLSGAALLGGLEWTVKFCEKSQAHLYHRARAHFETLWQDNEFSAYDPDDPHHRDSLTQALNRESGRDLIANVTFFELSPRSFQQEILEQLDSERSRGRFRNLLIAATGTGKTVMAAFDYERISRKERGRPRLLFVAHRAEILKQALRTYRQILRDAAFGELLTGHHQPAHYDHLFATIQSVQSRSLLERLGADYWQVVVIDECHHLKASSFDAFASAVQPKYFLGLTATPERADGKSILNYFDARPNGRPSAELRLWHALDLQLLAPFEYFACDDETDFRDIPWKKPGEVTALDNVLTGNVVRARSIVNAWRDLVVCPTRCKTLIFCVSIKHAEFMCQFLNDNGIVSKMVSAETPPDERVDIPRQLEQGTIHAIVTVDLYNEGVDLPFVDTLLLLRPTQSATLFQQQIGRGLRLFPDKESCLVLDFIGQHQREFRFDKLLGGITGLTRKELQISVEAGFGKLPSGCHIQLQKQARKTILDNLQVVLGQNWKRMQRELNDFVAMTSNRNPSLVAFLTEMDLELEDIYRSGSSNRSGWTNLRRDAGLLPELSANEDSYFSRRLESLTHVDDSEHLALIKRVADARGKYEFRDPTERVRAQMLAYQIDSQHHAVGSPEAFANRLARSEEICSELSELVQILDAKTTHQFMPLPGCEQSPLKLHAAYQLREIKVAFGLDTEEGKVPITSGVFPIKEKQLELLFVTLDKAEALHEGVAYNDYAISDALFHWQSQNAAGPSTNSGKRYLESPDNGWTFQLFVRENKDMPYRACGPVEFVESHGEKPMNITWKLTAPLSAELFRRFSVLRSA